MRKQTSKSYEYVTSLVRPENEKMLLARKNSESLGLGGISLSAVEASILQFFIKNTKTKKAVEIGTLTGLSAQYLLEALPKDGKLWTLEKSPQHVQLASQVLASDPRCQIIEGDAQEKLNDLTKEGPFDFIFIDSNKAAYMDYFQWAIRNISSQGIIILDNVFLAGAVWGDTQQQKFNEKQVSVMQQVNKLAFADQSLSSMIIPTEEGMLVCQKLGL